MDLDNQDLDMLFTKIKTVFDQFDEPLVGTPAIPESVKVSICMITYNHAEFVSECLDNILKQKTNFDFEVVISDDCSTDATADILRDFAIQNPHLSRVYLHPFNLSQTYKKFTPGKLNFLYALSRCTGEYIIFIEGDDYFCDENKLQKQVEFLDNHPEYSACFHNALMKFEDNSGRNDYLINPANQKSIIYSEDFLVEKETWFMATAAVMFRKSMIEKMPYWFAFSKSGDIPMYVILTEQAPIAYISDVMSVYRRHLAGLSYTDHTHDANFIENRIFMYSKINEFTRKKYKHLLHPILADYYKILADCKQNTNHSWRRFKAIIIALYYQKPKTKLEWKNFIKSLFTASVYTKIMKIKRFLF